MNIWRRSCGEVVTDGEFRRNIYSDAFTSSGISGISPQCGFSTSATSHPGVDEAMERAKLARMVEVTRAVWGD
jgi:hypothetical protein